MPVREPFPDFAPAHSAPSTPVAGVNYAAITDDESLHRTPTPSPSLPSADQTSIDAPPAQLQRPTNLITAITANAGPSIAVISGAIGLAAALEDPTCLPRLRELGNGLIGLVCAGGIALGVVALESVAEGFDAGIEEAWGRVWRWAKYGLCGEEGGEGEGFLLEEAVMFDEQGWSVVLGDEDELRTTPKERMAVEEADGVGFPATPPAQRSPERSLLVEKKNERLALPAFTFPPLPVSRSLNSQPSPPRQEFAYTSSSTDLSLKHPVPRRRANHDAISLLHSHSYPDENHASGLLGPSPMPPRFTAQPAWENFTGQGFHRHEQKLKAVNLWATPGRRDRTFDEILKEIEGLDDA